jgi:ankyrin repeat protein
MKSKKLVTVLGVCVAVATIAVLVVLAFGEPIITAKDDSMTKDETIAQELLFAIENNNKDSFDKALKAAKHLDFSNRLVFKGVLPLEQCARFGRYEFFKELLAQGADINTNPGENAYDLMLFACSGGNLDIVKYLESQGSSLDVAGSDNKNAALFAAESGSIEMFNYVTSHGVDPHAKTMFDEDVAMFSASATSLKLFDFLVSEGYSLDNKNSNGENFLFYATSDENLCTLIAKHKDKITALTSDNTNLLTHAVLFSYLQSLKMLIETKLFDVNNQDDEGNTALMLSIREGTDEEVIHLLIDNGADLSLKNDEGETAYDIAMRFESPYADILKIKE